jgi:hypothetical protein
MLPHGPENFRGWHVSPDAAKEGPDVAPRRQSAFAFKALLEKDPVLIPAHEARADLKFPKGPQ